MRKIAKLGIIGFVLAGILISGCCCCTSSDITGIKDNGDEPSGTSHSYGGELGTYDNPVPAGKTITLKISGLDNAEVEYSVRALARGEDAVNLLKEQYKKENNYGAFDASDADDYIIIYETLNVTSVDSPPADGGDFDEYSGHLVTSKGEAESAYTSVDKYSDGLNCDDLFPGQTLTGYTTLVVPNGTVDERLLFYREIGYQDYYFYL